MAKVIQMAPGQRAKEKQAARDEDVRRLVAGEITAEELQRENNWFFGSLDFSKARITAIGKKKINLPSPKKDNSSNK